MTASRHPPEDMLVSYAGGSLDEATSVLIATHLALCPACRKAVSCAEAIGGELMQELAPAPLPSSALGSVLARLDESPAPIKTETPGPSALGALLPRPLRDYVRGDLDKVKWQWKGVGVRYASLVNDPSGNKLGLLRVEAGVRVPHHGHASDELTMVLSGGYSSEFGSFARGDVEFADDSVVHQPVADTDGACLCLVITRGRLKPTGFLASLLMPLLAF